MPTLGIQTSVQNASNSSVLSIFASIRNNLISHRWLSSSNQLIRNCLININSGNYAPQDMSEYISVSSIFHCIDSWGFLGRAINCLTQGDSDTTRHLAYYAELRAAISILASQGIGIFNDKHFYIDNSGTSQRIPNNTTTHMMTWNTFSEWSVNSINSTNLITRIIKPNDHTLDEWLSQLPNYSGIRPLTSAWLKSWGIDLSQLPQDRNARNEASYRPTKMTLTRSVDPISSANFLCSLWELLQPSLSSRFLFLDRHLLRKSLISLFENTTYYNPLAPQPVSVDANNVINDRGYIKFIDDFLPNVASAGIISTYEINSWKTLLLNKHDPEIFSEAIGNVNVYDQKHHLQVMSRALLLSRIASGASSELLYRNGYSKNDVQFWWQSYGLDHALWDSTNEPVDFCDLWDEVQESIYEIETWKNNPTVNSFNNFQQDKNSHSLSILGSCERVALWGTNL